MSAAHADVPARQMHAALQPEARHKRHVPLLLIPTNGKLSCVALNDNTTPVSTHYDAATRKVVWCDESIFCHHCLKGWKRSVSRYLPILSLADKRQYLLVIPPVAYLYSASMLAAEGRLRGRHFEASRMGSSKSSPGKVTVSDRKFDPAELPVGWDVLCALAQRWNIAPPGDAWEGKQP